MVKNLNTNQRDMRNTINDGMINITPKQFEKLSSGQTIICELFVDSPEIETGDITSVWCEGKSLPVKIMHKYYWINSGMLHGREEVACVVLQEYKSDEVKLNIACPVVDILKCEFTRLNTLNNTDIFLHPEYDFDVNTLIKVRLKDSDTEQFVRITGKRKEYVADKFIGIKYHVVTINFFDNSVELNPNISFILPEKYDSLYIKLNEIINEFSKISIHEIHLNFPNGEVIINKGK